MFYFLYYFDSFYALCFLFTCNYVAIVIILCSLIVIVKRLGITFRRENFILSQTSLQREHKLSR